LITWQWRPASDAPDVCELIARAAAADQEMGFSTIAAMDSPDAHTFDLLVRTSLRGTTSGGGGRASTAVTSAGERDAGDTVLAGCIRLRADGAEAEACLLIDPDYRSLGIATAVLEGLGRPSSPGSRWPLPGLRQVAFWAAGSHPASERLASRLGLVPAAEVTRLRRRLSGGSEAGRPAGDCAVADLPDASEVAITELSGWRLPAAGRPAPAEDDRQFTRVALAPDGRVTGLVRFRSAGLATGEATTADRAGIITAIGFGPDGDRPAVMRALVQDAMVTLAAAGQDYAEVAVTAGDPDLAALLRSMRFRHDQTDVRYELS
jgi:mycothiol synthase